MTPREESDIALDDLPPDLQQLLLDLAEDAGVELPPRLVLRRIPLSDFPKVAIGTSRGDQRDDRYVEAMRGKALPPLVVADGVFIDGRHRLMALRLDGAQDADCIDLTGVVPAPQVPRIGWMSPARPVPGKKLPSFRG